MITIIKQPTGIYPLHNNSYLKFSSDLTDNTRAEIKVYPTSIFPDVFTIYPFNGVYLFNLKELVKVRSGGFKDDNPYTEFFESISDKIIEQVIDIEVFNETTSESVTKTYNFYNGLKRIEDALFFNNISNISENGIDYNLTYYEGFPFSIILPKIETNVKILNRNTSEELIINENGSVRINVDNGGTDNVMLQNEFNLTKNVNRLEVYDGSNFIGNLNLLRKRYNRGVLLKWFNYEGGYSYHLFEEFYKEKVKTKNIGNIFEHEFSNIGEKSGDLLSIGKTMTRKIAIKSYFDNEKMVEELFSSPFVQMYTSQKSYNKGRFIDVGLEGSYTFNTKRNKVKINADVLLPSVENITL